MNANDRSVFARIMSHASINHELSEDDATDTVTDFIPEFIAEYDEKPRAFKMTSDRMVQFLNQTHKKYGLNFDQNYIQTNIANDAVYKSLTKKYSRMVAAEKRNANAKLGTLLSAVLSVYSSQAKINELKIRYNSKNWHFDPSKALDKDPTNKKLIEERDQYRKYVSGVIRANRILKYLNNNRINSRIDVDSHDTTKLVAFLPEHNDMKVTIMADNPRDIGNVTTWSNILTFSQNKSENISLKDLPPEIIIDSVINPARRIIGLDSFMRQKGQPQRTNIYIKGLKVPIFSNSIKGSIKSLEDINDDALQIEKQEKTEINDYDNDDDDSLKITQHDKIIELQNRFKDYKYHEISTPADIQAEHENHGLYATIKQQGAEIGLKDLRVYKNSHNVYKFTYVTETPGKELTGYANQKTYRKRGFGIIGGYVSPEKDGSNKLVVNGKLRGYSVPGMRGYIDTKTGELKVKRFNSILREQIRKTMIDQILNPELNRSSQSYAALDNLYTTDSYSTIVNKGVNSPEYEKALIETLSNRIRLSNEDVEAANAANEDPEQRIANLKKLKNLPLKSDDARRNMLAKTDLRTIPPEWQKYVDREMTGIGKTMGASLFLGDDVKINKDGSLSVDSDRTYAKTALHKLPLFDYDKYDPADRNIMAFNQAIRNVPLDKVNVAMMTLSGYTENDAAVVSQKYAHNHQIVLPDGTTRDLKRGDKITDLHGNKSTISEIIDPDEKDPERQQRLAREIAIIKANPDLDVIVNPYSSISRLNTGSIHEMQDNGLTQLNSPKGYNIDLSNVSMGKEVYAVCVGQRVDEKTRVYTEEDYQAGDSRRFSHQLAASAAAADLPKLLSFVYGNNQQRGWPRFFDDLHIMGYDIDKQHRLGYFDYDSANTVTMKIPSDKKIAEISVQNPYDRKELEKTVFKESFKDALSKAQKDNMHKSIVMPLKQSYKNAAGNMTDKLIIPYNEIAADAELALKMGTQSNKVSSQALNDIHRIFDYNCGIRQDYKPVLDENGNKVYNNKGRVTLKQSYSPEHAIQSVNSLTNRIIARDFGKDNIIKGQIYSAPMPDSATAVITPDPNLDIDEIAVGPDIYDNLNLPEDKSKEPLITIWRDPSLRSGALRSVHVTKDKTLTGVAINPVITKSMDADFDGDTVAVVPIHDAEVQEELKKQMPSQNLINKAAKEPESYLETGLELQGSLYRQHDISAQHDLADPNVQPDTVRSIVKEAFSNDAAYGIGIDARTEDSYLDSLSKLIESGAKGHCERDKNGAPLRDANNRVVSKQLMQAQHYYDGYRTAQDYHESMIGSAVKVDGVGPAGAIQQKLLWVGRNENPNDIMNLTYLSTQAVLQAKHDGKAAIKRMHAVLRPMPQIMSGQLLVPGTFGHNNNSKMSVEGFINATDDLYNKDLGLNVNNETINGVAEVLRDKHNNIMQTPQRIEKADPIDLLAYKHTNVTSLLDNAIATDKKIASGRYTKCFSMPDELCSERVLGQYYKEAQKKQQEQQAHEEIRTRHLNKQTSQQSQPTEQVSTDSKETQVDTNADNVPTATLSNNNSIEMF